MNVRPDAAVVTATDQVETVLVHRQAGHAVQMSHHGVHHCSGVVVIEPDVSVLVTSDGQWQGGVGEDSIDGAHSLTNQKQDLVTIDQSESSITCPDTGSADVSSLMMVAPVSAS